MDTWQWQTWQGLPYLTCTLLDRWPHAFLTRQFGGRSPRDLSPILQPDSQTYCVKQVHSNIVLDSETLSPVEEQPTGWPQADGLFSQKPGRSLWVSSADCTPVLLADDRRGWVAAIHAGWRGTAARIVPVAIEMFLDRGSAIADLRIALGPAISGEMYQVSTEVGARVGATVLDPVPDSDTEICDRLFALPHAPLLADPEPGKVRLDVRRVIALQVLKLGATADRIAIAPQCTYRHDDRFFSYRRTGDKDVQRSGIVAV